MPSRTSSRSVSPKPLPNSNSNLSSEEIFINKRSKCKHCHLQFNSPLHLKRHDLIGCTIFSYHELSIKACDNCEDGSYEDFDEDVNLFILKMHKRHCEYITNIPPDKFSCSICERTFDMDVGMQNKIALGEHALKFDTSCGLVLDEELASANQDLSTENLESSLSDSESEFPRSIPDSSSRPSYSCHFCKAKFRKVKFLVKHLVEDYVTCFRNMDETARNDLIKWEKNYVNSTSKKPPRKKRRVH